jgi:hypothetical protein
MWPIKDFDKKGVQPVRMNIEQDHATHIAFTQNNTACVVALGGANKLRLMQVSVKNRSAESKVRSAACALLLGVASFGMRGVASAQC